MKRGDARQVGTVPRTVRRAQPARPCGRLGEASLPPAAPQAGLRAWLGAMRLWSLTAATVPVAAGAALAAQDGRFSWPLLALTLVCGWLLQIATNLLNMYGDFRSGVDVPGACPTCPQLVDGTLAPRAVFAAGVAALALAAALGVAAAALSDWRLLLFAAAGVAGAAGYTTGVRYKYAGLGVPAVFLLMGVLMVMASYYAQACDLAWRPLVASLPVSFLVAAILHGNDLRDIATDRAAGIKTTTLAVGDRSARTLFYALHLAPHGVMLAGVASGLFSPWTLLTLLSLPLTAGALRACAAGQSDKLEGLSAGVHFVFGTLLVLGLALALFF